LARPSDDLTDGSAGPGAPRAKPIAPSAPPSGGRIPAHSVVITVLILAIGAALASQLVMPDAASPGGPRSSSSAGVGNVSPSPSERSTPLPTPRPPGGPQVVYAVGDLSDCPSALPEVADLVRSTADIILALGDIVHPGDSASEYQTCFDPVWGDLKTRIRPVPGNHDYNTPDGSAYYDYFEGRAGDPTKGYYSFNVGTWHVVALNSICSKVGGCRPLSPQVRWLKADLEAHPNRCTLAYWHHPRFSSGDGATLRRTEAFWHVLYEAGADVVLNGHDHDYERFAPMNPAGQADARRGIRQFVVGTGGANLTRLYRLADNSQVWTRDNHGVLELTLRRTGYDWRFLAAGSGAVIDQGSERCH
jgi:hypothetical protein